MKKIYEFRKLLERMGLRKGRCDRFMCSTTHGEIEFIDNTIKGYLPPVSMYISKVPWDGEGRLNIGLAIEGIDQKLPKRFRRYADLVLKQYKERNI